MNEEMRGLTVILIETSSSADRVNENVVMITSSLPEGKATEVVVLDEVTLSRERLGVIERDHELRSLVVDEGL